MSWRTRSNDCPSCYHNRRVIVVCVYRDIHQLFAPSPVSVLRLRVIGFPRSPVVAAGRALRGLPLGARPAPPERLGVKLSERQMVWQRSGPTEPNDLSGEAA